MSGSKIIVAVAAWLLLNAIAALWMVASSSAPIGSPFKLGALAAVVIAATAAIGLFRHRRWGMWLYFAYAVPALALLVSGAGREGPLFTALALAAILVPAILIWIRRDRLTAPAAERPNA